MTPESKLVDCDIVAAALDVGLLWPMADLVPILDVFRVALLHEQLNTHFCDMKVCVTLSISVVFAALVEIALVTFFMGKQVNIVSSVCRMHCPCLLLMELYCLLSSYFRAYRMPRMVSGPVFQRYHIPLYERRGSGC